MKDEGCLSALVTSGSELRPCSVAVLASVRWCCESFVTRDAKTTRKMYRSCCGQLQTWRTWTSKARQPEIGVKLLQTTFLQHDLLHTCEGKCFLAFTIASPVMLRGGGLEVFEATAEEGQPLAFSQLLHCYTADSHDPRVLSAMLLTGMTAAERHSWMPNLEDHCVLGHTCSRCIVFRRTSQSRS